MTQKSKNRFELNNGIVTIYRDSWPCSAQCTYREDYWEELISHTWRMDKNKYPVNQKLGGGLHRYMMKKWYGEKALAEFSKKKYVVDHINNDHSDCRITNLEFLKKDYNTAKGQQLDKDAPRLRQRIALGITKDFDTECYQITIGCNDCICGYDNNGKLHVVDSIKLLYSGGYNNYPLVINDAENILLSYENGNGIHVERTNATCVRVYYAPSFELTEEEKENVVVTRNGKSYLVIGNGKTYVYRVAPDLGWTIPDDYEGKQIITHIWDNGDGSY